MKLLDRYNALCSRPFVGLLMIPLTIGVVLAPALLLVWIMKRSGVIPILFLAALLCSCESQPRPIVLIRASNGEITVLPNEYVSKR